MESNLNQPVSKNNKLPSQIEGRGGSLSKKSGQTVVLDKKEYLELTKEVNYWKNKYERSEEQRTKKANKLKESQQKWKDKYNKVKREKEQLEKELEAAKARIRDLEKRLYGAKSEKHAKSEKLENQNNKNPKRNRGQQPGSKGHGRKPKPELPVFEEERFLTEEEKRCPICGAAYEDFPGTDDSEVIEVEVRGYIRRRKCHRAKKTCQCGGVPGIITAPAQDRVLPRTPYGVSVWVTIILDKHLYSRPTNQLVQELSAQGIPLSAGTIAGSLGRMIPLFEPVIQALYDKQMKESLFLVDETRWQVYVEIDEKGNYRWYVWVMRSESVIYYYLEPTRSASVPQEHFAPIEHKIIVVCDRYSSYKSLENTNEWVTLAHCWVHMRRDFLNAGHKWPELEEWSLEWIEQISIIYELNGARLEQWDETQAIESQSEAFNSTHEALKAKLEELKQRCEQQREEQELHPGKKQALNSLSNHWESLNVFVDHPQVPMDNNGAEQAIRKPVLGRKNYYGSGSLESAQFTAMMFSLIQTLILNGINPHYWFYAFLQACAQNGGYCPSDLSPFLPWEMDEQRRQELSKPLPLHFNTPEVIDTS